MTAVCSRPHYDWVASLGSWSTQSVVVRYFLTHLAHFTTAWDPLCHPQSHPVVVHLNRIATAGSRSSSQTSLPNPTTWLSLKLYRSCWQSRPHTLRKPHRHQRESLKPENPRRRALHTGPPPQPDSTTQDPQLHRPHCQLASPNRQDHDAPPATAGGPRTVCRDFSSAITEKK